MNKLAASFGMLLTILIYVGSSYLIDEGVIVIPFWLWLLLPIIVLIYLIVIITFITWIGNKRK